MSSTLRIGVAGLCTLAALGIGLILFTLIHPVALLPAVHEPTTASFKVTYLVTAHSLPAGTLVREEDFAAKPMAPSNEPSSALTDSPDTRAGLRGALVRRFIDAGTPIVADDFLRPRDRGFIASVLEPGTVAATIGVDAISGVGGLIWPGDHVNVLLTQSIEHAPPASKALSETVLSNVRVIAIDQEMVQGASGDNSATAGKLARTVTVQVTPEQAQKLTVAQQIGKLSLSIRSATDQTVLETKPTYGSDVSEALNRNDQPIGSSVRVIDGKESKIVSFPGGS